jgi:hypothetical protein
MIPFLSCYILGHVPQLHTLTLQYDLDVAWVNLIRKSAIDKGLSDLRKGNEVIIITTFFKRQGSVIPVIIYQSKGLSS